MDKKLDLERVRIDEQEHYIENHTLERVTAALQKGSLTHRDLVRASHLPAGTVNLVIERLQDEGRVKVVEVPPNTRYITLLPTADELEEQRKRRLARMASKGLL